MIPPPNSGPDYLIGSVLLPHRQDYLALNLGLYCPARTTISSSSPSPPQPIQMLTAFSAQATSALFDRFSIPRQGSSNPPPRVTQTLDPISEHGSMQCKWFDWKHCVAAWGLQSGVVLGASNAQQETRIRRAIKCWVLRQQFNLKLEIIWYLLIFTYLTQSFTGHYSPNRRFLLLSSNE